MSNKETQAPRHQNIYAALAAAQREFGPVLKAKVNPAFKSRYADLASVIEACVEALNNHGIYFSQHTSESEGNAVVVETVMYHESGNNLSFGRLRVPVNKVDAQGFGSALTYARRYSAMAALGVAPEDDDGNAAVGQQGGGQQRQQQRAAAPAPAPSPAMPDDIKQEWVLAIESCESIEDLDAMLDDARKACAEINDKPTYRELAAVGDKVRKALAKGE